MPELLRRCPEELVPTNRPTAALIGLLCVLLAGWSGCTSHSKPAQTVEEPAPADTSATAQDTTAVPTDAPLAERLEAATIEARAIQALAQRRSLRVFDFEIEVRAGSAVLRGDVNTLEQRNRAAGTVLDVAGVSAVENQLTVGGRPAAEVRARGETENASGSETAVYHTVRSGDTLWDIASEYNASVERIRQLNDFDPDALRPGQRIRVR
jgi:LysM repeat protein